MTDFIKACIKANEEIASACKDGFDTSWFEKTEVGAGGDVSSKLDLFAEEIFVKHLSVFGQIESEESGIIGEGEEQIIIDPIDGSANALSLFPFYGTSVAKVNAEGILDAAVVCNLANRDIFFKSSTSQVQQGKLFSDTFHDPHSSEKAEIGLFEKAYANPGLVALLDQEKLKFRSPGAIALSLAYAHTVSYVLFMGEFRIYDFAAGLALCEGLEVIVEADYVIVSKEKSIAKKIESLIDQL
ncbi:inositol monophosphatase family protein [Sulfurovum sp. TSL1]|uniref:inositol monophosphatase family protein n=1 Tax=Sulfurovum sp. TSL1 TaxID=2826994 RepID=UPI001CC64A6A|nr:inositol monophosphatase family protein [Sulfurovum sp. TSL1]GIT97241.1 inositol monophosphatase [Sulfurovum sp. TSL1]